MYSYPLIAIQPWRWSLGLSATIALRMKLARVPQLTLQHADVSDAASARVELPVLAAT